MPEEVALAEICDGLGAVALAEAAPSELPDVTGGTTSVVESALEIDDEAALGEVTDAELDGVALLEVVELDALAAPDASDELEVLDDTLDEAELLDDALDEVELAVELAVGSLVELADGSAVDDAVALVEVDGDVTVDDAALLELAEGLSLAEALVDVALLDDGSVEELDALGSDAAAERVERKISP